jgi:hypothetical protein
MTGSLLFKVDATRHQLDVGHLGLETVGTVLAHIRGEHRTATSITACGTLYKVLPDEAKLFEVVPEPFLYRNAAPDAARRHASRCGPRGSGGSHDIFFKKPSKC